MSYLDDTNLTRENVLNARAIMMKCKPLQIPIQKLNDDNEMSLLLDITQKAETIIILSEDYQKDKTLSDLDYANEVCANAHSILDTVDRLHPTVKEMWDRILMQTLYQIALISNSILMINQTYAENVEKKEEKHLRNTVNEILKDEDF